jgi:hypothetical protein
VLLGVPEGSAAATGENVVPFSCAWLTSSSGPMLLDTTQMLMHRRRHAV